MSVSREEMLAEARRRGLIPTEPQPAAPPADRMGAVEHGARTAVAGFLGNVLGIPHAAGELLAMGGAIPQTVTGAAGAAMRGEPMQIGQRFGDARAQQQQQFPASLLRRAPNPSAQDVLAAVETVKNVPGAAMSGIQQFRQQGGPAPNPMDALAAARQQGVAEAQAQAQAHPVATTVGEIAGDIGTLAAGRPSLRALLKSRDKSKVVPEAKEAADSATRILMRGLGRTAEAGFEGAVIAALNDADPATTAAWSAGVQAGGSAALTAKNIIRHAPLKSFGTIWLGHEMYKALVPGPQNAFDSKDETVRELVAAFGLGIIGAMAGAGRGFGQGEVRRITDALSTASRGGIASVISQLQSAQEQGQPHYEQVISAVTANPAHFGPEIRNRLERAARSEKPNALLREIDSMMRNSYFRRKYEELEIN